MTDIEAAAGTTIQIQSVVTNLIDGSPRNLAGATGTLLVYDAPDSVNPAVATGIASVTDPVGGVMSWTLPPSATSAMTGQFHVLFFTCMLTELDGTKSLCDSGKLTLS